LPIEASMPLERMRTQECSLASAHTTLVRPSLRTNWSPENKIFSVPVTQKCLDLSLANLHHGLRRTSPAPGDSTRQACQKLFATCFLHPVRKPRALEQFPCCAFRFESDCKSPISRGVRTDSVVRKRSCVGKQASSGFCGLHIDDCKYTPRQLMRFFKLRLQERLSDPKGKTKQQNDGLTRLTFTD
jgi:hypothetical protein